MTDKPMTILEIIQSRIEKMERRASISDSVGDIAKYDAALDELEFLDELLDVMKGGKNEAEIPTYQKLGHPQDCQCFECIQDD